MKAENSAQALAQWRMLHEAHTTGGPGAPDVCTVMEAAATACQHISASGQDTKDFISDPAELAKIQFFSSRFNTT